MRRSTARCLDGLSARACHVPPVQKKSLLRSWRDPVEAGVVVAGVVAGGRRRRHVAAANDAACATIARTGRGDGVFAIEAAPLGGQDPFAVSEHRAVLRITKRAARK